MRTVVKGETAWMIAAARTLLRQVVDVEFSDCSNESGADGLKLGPRTATAATVDRPAKCVKSVELFYFNYCRRRDRGRPKPKMKEYWQQVQQEWQQLDPAEKSLHYEHWAGGMQAAYNHNGVRRAAGGGGPLQIVPVTHGPEQYRAETWFRRGADASWQSSTIIDPSCFKELTDDVGKTEEAATAKMFADYPGLAKAVPRIPKVVKWCPPTPELRGLAAQLEKLLLKRARMLASHGMPCWLKLSELPRGISCSKQHMDRINDLKCFLQFMVSSESSEPQ